MFSLAGKKALVLGVANEDSIAFGCAKAFRDQGADLAITYQNERAEQFVRPLAEKLGTEILLPLDVREDGQYGQLFDRIRQIWGHIDICLHSIAFCPREDLHGRVVDCSRNGFITAMDISVYSFIRMVRRAEPLMRHGGSCMTVSFFGAEKVVENYNIMGPAKAALESVTRYMAAELGPKGISVNALSPGPLKTRAASGISRFDELMNEAASRAPTTHLASIEDVGAYAAFLASREAENVTGGVHYIDGGYHIVG
ncbi:enoyl-ACP reductase [Methyloceanibacter methanicus]|uniref:Enoyl-[acyl-carrier-protein] reductase [NADH] n=1 Tax=Methyloceanibacter methanicus TaxID=1774968 RepID=A0A1E3W7N9_9HYPH|nr:enoyl-ACP reductase FabI [Methyloceanibacter methanicus]ODS01117.1 enoyl-ACP reductase [Methyloceanibacter methanicus]